MGSIQAFEHLVSILDYVLESKRRRHIVGGGLLSISALFAGLAITAMTLNQGEEEEDDD